MGPNLKSIHLNESLSNDLSLPWRMRTVIKKITSVVVLTNNSKGEGSQVPNAHELLHRLDLMLVTQLYLTTQIVPMAPRRSRYCLHEKRYL